MNRALQADPNLAEVQASVGYVAFLLDWDWARAEDALRRAIELDSHYALAHRLLGHLLRAYEARDVHLIFLTADHKWDQYRNNPRFKTLLRRCGFMR